MNKRVFYTEIAYIAGILLLAIGTAFMEEADFGLSMVVAPAYLTYIKISQFWPEFTFGTAEYLVQIILIIVLSLILKRFKRVFVFSFITTVFYGIVLDFMMVAVDYLPGGYPMRVALFIIGEILCASGVSLLFHTYLAPEAYELFVKEISFKYKWDINKVKTVYDCCSCIVAVIMSFIFVGFMKFEGVEIGTVICAVVNGWIIGKCSKIFEKYYDFKDGLALRKYFE